MASLGPSPPKRLKISPPRNQELQSQRRPASPSKLPVRNGSTVRTIASKGGLYSSPNKGKPNLGLPRRSPFAERPAPPKTNGSGAGDPTVAGKLNFGSTAGLREGGGGGGRFRRAGGPRLSQSPARRNSFFSESNPGSSVRRMANLGEESESPPQSAEEDKSSPIEKIHKSRKMDTLKTKGKEKEAAVGPAKRPRPETTEEGVERKQAERISSENEALRKLIEARVNALRMEVEELREEVQKQETREAPGPGSDVEAVIKRLLAANDSSHVALPKLKPTTAEDPEAPSARPLTAADPLLQLSAFHCLTFTSTSSTIASSTPDSVHTDDETIQLPSRAAPEDPDQLNLTQRHTAHGYGSNRLLFFNFIFTVSSPSWTVTQISFEVSPWSRRELQAPLAAAAQEGNINTIVYALSSYTLLAKKRAAVFSRLCQTFPHLLPVFAPVARNRAVPAAVGRRDIVPWLGATLLRFHSRTEKDAAGRARYTSSSESGGVELVVSWEIGIGVGGEAESKVEADVRVPLYWMEVDELKTFSKVGEIFRLLVKERGVFEATKCVVGLIFQ